MLLWILLLMLLIFFSNLILEVDREMTKKTYLVHHILGFQFQNNLEDTHEDMYLLFWSIVLELFSVFKRYLLFPEL